MRNVYNILKTFRTKRSDDSIRTDVRMPDQCYRTRICHKLSCIRICSTNSLSTHVCQGIHQRRHGSFNAASVRLTLSRSTISFCQEMFN